MNKLEFIKMMQIKSNLSEQDSKLALETIIDIITENLMNNEPIKFIGFGTFYIEKTTKTFIKENEDSIKSRIRNEVKFKVGRVLKEAVL